MTKPLAARRRAGAVARRLHGRPRLRAPRDRPAEGLRRRASRRRPSPSDWWTLFNDPVLDTLVDEALAANRDLQGRRRAHRAGARAVRDHARRSSLPTRGHRGERSRDRSLGAASVSAAARCRRDQHQPPGAARVLGDRLLGQVPPRHRSGARGARRHRGRARRDPRTRSSARWCAATSRCARSTGASRSLERTLEGRREGARAAEAALRRGHRLRARAPPGASPTCAGAEALVPAARAARVRQEGALAVLLGRSPREVFAGAASTAA